MITLQRLATPFTFCAAIALSGCAAMSPEEKISYETSWADRWACEFDGNGSATNAPCVDGRVSTHTHTQPWLKLQNSGLTVVGHSWVRDTLSICGGEYACKIGDEYHTTNGDVKALVQLVSASQDR